MLVLWIQYVPSMLYQCKIAMMLLQIKEFCTYYINILFFSSPTRNKLSHKILAPYNKHLTFCSNN